VPFNNISVEMIDVLSDMIFSPSMLYISIYEITDFEFITTFFPFGVGFGYITYVTSLLIIEVVTQPQL